MDSSEDIISLRMFTPEFAKQISVQIAPCALDSILDFCAIYLLFVCLYRVIPHLYLFLHFFLTYLLLYLSFPLRIDPLRFQAGCCKRRLNLAFVCLCLFCVVVYFF